jgi:hypothetical protein
MKQLIPYLLCLCICIAAFVQFACSVSEEKQASADYPQLKSTTQAAEKVQAAIDPVAVDVQHVATGVQTVATEASGLGLPGASTVALLAGLFGTIAGVYNERRNGTVPLKDAFTQVVQSVEAAFPSKTDAQKSALASVQDQSTRALVTQVKGV